MERESSLEWRIENFTCWHKHVHGNRFVTRDIILLFYEKLELYPRGLSGQNEHIMVRIYQGSVSNYAGDLSLIASDGSLICTEEIKRKSHGTPIEIIFKPSFEEVVSQVKNKESQHGDRLTLKIQFEKGFHKRYLCTTIGVLNISMKIDPKVLIDNAMISSIKYYHGKVEEETFYLQTDSSREDGKMKIQLKSPSIDGFVYLVRSCTSLLSNDNTVVGHEEKEHLFRHQFPWTFSDTLTRQELIEKGITLLLSFKIIYSGVSYKAYECVSFNAKKIILDVPNHNLSAKTPSAASNSVEILSKDLMGLYQDQNFSDFEIRSGDLSFATHKGILSARSPVFKSVLSSDMREASSGYMDITDLDPPTLTRFLAFLYSGTVEDLRGESALKLYYAADKYQVETLKRECADFLTANVSVSSVCDVLWLADKHRDEELKKVAQDFMLDHYNEVLRSEEWKVFMGGEPSLALETVTYFAEKGYIGKVNISL